MSKFTWTFFISAFAEHFPDHQGDLPWIVTERVREMVRQRLKNIGKLYKVTGDAAIHKSATIESNVTLKGPVIIGPNCFVASGSYLRGGVILMDSNTLGPGTELKSSILFPSSKLAHFNFVGDSVIGSHVNFEGGAVIANHYNERKEKTINVVLNKESINTRVEKFGALVGDGCKVGANAVLSPGTILSPGQLVGRLQLVDQTAS